MQPGFSVTSERVRSILVSVLSIIGLVLLGIYGSKAVAGADDQRFVEGKQKTAIVGSNDSINISALTLGGNFAQHGTLDVVTSPQIEAPKPTKAHKASSSHHKTHKHSQSQGRSHKD